MQSYKEIVNIGWFLKVGKVNGLRWFSSKKIFTYLFALTPSRTVSMKNLSASGASRLLTLHA